MTTRDEGLVLVEREAPFGRVRLALVDHANGFTRDACALTIDPLQMSDGRGGKLAVHGIGNVETMEAYRRRWLATQLMHASIERMRSGGADASLLYGIDGFYGPFGWRTCGDERWVSVDLESGARLAQSGASCVARPMRNADLEVVTETYEAIASGVPGAILRPGDSRAWHLLDPEDTIIVERGDTLVGWAWRGRGAVHERAELAMRIPDAAAFAELQALDEDAMRAVVDQQGPEHARHRPRRAKARPARRERAAFHMSRPGGAGP